MRTRVKICGVRDPETALVCARHGADAVGVVFAEGSPRCVTMGEAASVTGALPPFVVSVGLFVDAEMERIIDACERCALGMVQLHGHESPEVCADVHATTRRPVLKAVRFDASTIEATIRAYGAVEGVCGLLVDGSAGGHGETFDWEALAPSVRSSRLPVVLAGGLTPENVGDGIAALRPFGVDVSSGVERERGVKDHALIGSFVDRVRREDCVGREPA